MDKSKIKRIIEARYRTLEYFNSRTVGLQLVCYIRFSNLKTFSALMNQKIILIGKEVTRITHADVKSYQFM